MKNKYPVITLLGNNSGRNLGDGAILSSILESISKKMPNALFYAPAVYHNWMKKHYEPKYNLKAIDVMPWTGSIRLLGIPTIRCFLKSDVALICDGIIFGKKLFNPAFNYLITLFFLAPIAKLCKCKLVCFNCGIGPFPSKISELMARYVIDSSDLIMFRENDSKQLAREIGVKKDILITADSAFINPVSSDSVAIEILKNDFGISKDTPLVGVNVTSYMDSWLKKDEKVEDKNEFLLMIANAVKDTCETLKKKYNENIKPVIFSTQPMDEEVCNFVAENCDGIVINNSIYLSHDIQAIMRRCKILVGMRFHALILASAVRTPIIALVYAPKVRGYMRQLETTDLSLELAKITKDSLTKTLIYAYENASEIQKTQQEKIDILRIEAEKATDILKERYFSDKKN
ncbi:MAG: polysaccharide pyruvyl transferase family protein [Bdellovibrionota bacterium]